MKISGWLDKSDIAIYYFRKCRIPALAPFRGMTEDFWIYPVTI
jgi:hypothetical protein